MKLRQLPPQARAAFTLVEVTLAIGVAAFGLVAIFGLLPTGYSANEASLEQSAAGRILSAVVADLRSTPVTTPRGLKATSQQFGLTIPAEATQYGTSIVYVTTEGVPSATYTPGSLNSSPSHFVVMASFVPASTSGSRAPTCVRLTVTWPATPAAIPTPGPSATPLPVRGLGSVEQLVMLDRN